jgi:hypothetical protein
MSIPTPVFPLFRTVEQLWQKYCEYALLSFPSNDPRHNLSAEVRERIEQLDECLELVSTSMESIQPDPLVVQEHFRYILEFGPRVSSGEISEIEYIAKMPDSGGNPLVFARDFARIRLFTETFYFVAWRLRQIINSPQPRKFPHLVELHAVAVRNVRNLLIEHPEHGGESAQFEKSMVITDNGPVLKSAKMVYHFSNGRTKADENSLDQGLFVNATAFEAELRSLLLAAIK